MNSKSFRILLIVLGWWMRLASHAWAGSEVQFAPPAGWVESLPEPELTPTAAADVSHGYDYFLLHRHVRVAEQAGYYRNMYRITTESALQSGARVTWDFDPLYETLTLHHLRVIRDGVVQDRLDPKAIKTIQQERDLDRHMLNGRLTAFVLLEDIRVGDVVDYAFTRQGWNPTFEGRYFDRLATGWAVPMRHQRYRIDTPSDRPLADVAHGPAEKPVRVTRVGDRLTYEWEQRNLPAREGENEAPSWCDQFPSIQFSEFQEWSSVVAWALPLYAIAEPLAPEIVAKAAEIVREAVGEEEKILALLQFIQQDVRYLGMELGAGSYRPTQPAVALARRFGDCKDKTLLFCALLRAVGLTAYPALLHTDYRGRIDAWLPSPHAFDHVIACVETATGRHWVDPTLTYQGGGLAQRGLPPYERALVVKPGETGLVAIVPTEGARRVTEITERFDVTGFDQPARYEVITRMTGTSAEGMRRYLAQNTPDQITKEYVNYYTSAYPGLVSTRPITWSDDRRHNVVTTVESYEVPHLWEKQDDGRLKAEFFPKNIADFAARPQRPVRSAPLALAHPVAIKMTTTVHLPEDWNVTPDETVTEGEGFRGLVGIKHAGRIVTMAYAWESLADHIPAEKVAGYVKTLNRFRESLGYTLTRGESAPAAAGGTTASGRYRINWLMVLVALLTLTAAAVVAVWICRRPSMTPPPLPVGPADEKLVGLRGWLWLVALGVVVRPFVMIGQLATTVGDTFDQAVWENITTPGQPGYQAALGPLVMWETGANLILLATSVLMVVLFFGRKRTFPGTFIFLAAFLLVVHGVDLWVGTNLLTATETKESATELTRAVGQAVIWIPYMLVSRRVKLTFTR